MAYTTACTAVQAVIQNAQQSQIPGERLTLTSGDLREMSHSFMVSYLLQRLPLSFFLSSYSALMHENFVSADEEPDL